MKTLTLSSRLPRASPLYPKDGKILPAQGGKKLKS